jgi:mycothiol synthase
MDLPEGVSARPLVADDALTVYRVMVADQIAQLGTVVIELEDIVADWQRPSFDLATSTIGAFAGAELIGYAEHSGDDRGEISVHPDHVAGPLFAELAGWLEGAASAAGAPVISTTVPQGGSSDRALASLGYRERWTTWVLELPPEASIAARPLPEGYTLRAATEADYPSAHEVIADAFAEWSTRERPPLEDFLAETVQRPGFEPWMLRIVTDATGQTVAAAYLTLSPGEAFIPKLATRADQRGQGLAQALLGDCFARGRERGATICSLSTDSRTGALSLYEKVGMVVVATWVNRAKDV